MVVPSPRQSARSSRTLRDKCGQPLSQSVVYKCRCILLSLAARKHRALLANEEDAEVPSLVHDETGGVLSFGEVEIGNGAPNGTTLLQQV